MTRPSYSETFQALQNGTLDPHSFSHRDHIAVAVEALNQFGFFEGTFRYARGLRDLAERAGVPEKFNATITFASMSLIAERLHAGGYSDADTFLRDNATLFTKAFLTQQYRDHRCMSDLAREVPLLPRDQFSDGSNDVV